MGKRNLKITKIIKNNKFYYYNYIQYLPFQNSRKDAEYTYFLCLPIVLIYISVICNILFMLYAKRLK